MIVDRQRLIQAGVVLVAVFLGFFAQGCYADWRFVRDARYDIETTMMKQFKALQQQNQQLQQELDAAKKAGK